MKIDESVYENWIRHPCTQKLFNEILKDKVQKAYNMMHSKAVCIDDHTNREAARWYGHKEAFEYLASLGFDEFKTTEESLDA